MKKSLLAMLMLFGAGMAHADSPWIIKIGASDVIPKGNGGTLANAFTASASNDVQFTPSIEYAFDHHLSAEVLLATPFTHDVYLNGTKAASFKDLPPTVTLKYTFDGVNGIRPYFGLGVNYTLVWGEKTVGPIAGNKAEAGNSLGMAGLIGVQYDIPNTPYGIALDLRRIDIASQMKLNGNKIGTLNVDPWVVGIGGTYHF